MFSRLVIWLVLGHCLGDWWFQSSVTAKKKVNNFRILLEHSIIYSVITALCGYYVMGSLKVFISLLIFNLGFHILLDMRWFELKWIEIFITKENPADWLIFVIDQTFHLVSIILIAEIVTKGM